MKKFILSFLFFIPFISYGQNSSQLESFEKIKGVSPKTQLQAYSLKHTIS